MGGLGSVSGSGAAAGGADQSAGGAKGAIPAAAAVTADAIGPAGSSNGSTSSVGRPGEVLVPFLRVSVEDHGPGLTQDEIGKLFHAYSQIRAGANQGGGGTGLGLVNCKRIVELAGGTVGVTSTPGVRTNFFMEIPLVLPQDGGPAAAAESQDQAALQAVARRAAEAGRQAESAAAAAAPSALSAGSGGPSGGGGIAWASQTDGMSAEGAATGTSQQARTAGGGGALSPLGSGDSASAIAISVRSLHALSRSSSTGTAGGASVPGGATAVLTHSVGGTGLRSAPPVAATGAAAAAVSPMSFSIPLTVMPAPAAASPMSFSIPLTVMPVPADPAMLASGNSGAAAAASGGNCTPATAAASSRGYGSWVTGDGSDSARSGATAAGADGASSPLAPGDMPAQAAPAASSGALRAPVPAGGPATAATAAAAASAGASAGTHRHQHQHHEEDADEEVAVVGELGYRGERDRERERDDGGGGGGGGSRRSSTRKSAGAMSRSPTEPHAAANAAPALQVDGRDERHDTAERAATSGNMGSQDSGGWRNGGFEVAEVDGDPEAADVLALTGTATATGASTPAGVAATATSGSRASAASSTLRVPATPSQGSVAATVAAGNGPGSRRSSAELACRPLVAVTPVSASPVAALPGVPAGTTPLPLTIRAQPPSGAGDAAAAGKSTSAAGGGVRVSPGGSPCASVDGDEKSRGPAATRGAAQALLHVAPDAAAAAAGDDSSLYGQKKLLRAVVVDDVSTNRELFARMLTRNGVDVVFTAEDGQDCLNKLAAFLRANGEAVPDSFPATAARTGSPLPGSPLASAAAACTPGRLARTPSGRGSLSGSGGASSPVVHSATAAAGVGATIDRAIQAFFVDSSMPVMDGPQLAQRLRALGCTNPIIGVTGNALAEDRQEFVRAGASFVLVKPCTGQHLREAVASLGLAFP